MMDDKQLLHAYERERSESAFGELVTRLRLAPARQEAEMKLQDYEMGQPRNAVHAEGKLRPSSAVALLRRMERTGQLSALSTSRSAFITP